MIRDAPPRDFDGGRRPRYRTATLGEYYRISRVPILLRIQLGRAGRQQENEQQKEPEGSQPLTRGLCCANHHAFRNHEIPLRHNAMANADLDVCPSIRHPKLIRPSFLAFLLAHVQLLSLVPCAQRRSTRTHITATLR